MMNKLMFPVITLVFFTIAKVAIVTVISLTHIMF